MAVSIRRMVKSFLEGFDAAGRLLLFFVKHELAHPCAYRRGVGLKLSKSGKQFLNSTTPAHFSPGGALKEGIACILSEGYLDLAVAAGAAAPLAAPARFASTSGRNSKPRD